MKPYYEKRGITIYHGDCREVLPQLKAGSCDLIVTDPPYGVRWQSGYRRKKFAVMKGDDDPRLGAEVTALALRVLRGDRHLYVFGRHDFSGLKLRGSVELIWDKMLIGLSHSHGAWSKSHEVISFAVKTDESKRRFDSGAARMRRGTVLRYRRLNGSQVRHPAEKPVGLLRELIESSSRMGEMVLDYFAGVGSTLVAAALEGRRAVGIEIEERWCEVAAKRLAQDVLKLLDGIQGGRNDSRTIGGG